MDKPHRCRGCGNRISDDRHDCPAVAVEPPDQPPRGELDEATLMEWEHAAQTIRDDQREPDVTRYISFTPEEFLDLIAALRAARAARLLEDAVVEKAVEFIDPGTVNVSPYGPAFKALSAAVAALQAAREGRG